MAKTEHMMMFDLQEQTAAEREGVTASEMREALRATPSPVDFLGTWVNIDSHTGGIVRLILGWAGSLNVHAYGACSPTPCDWKTVPAMSYSLNVSSNRAVAFSAQYNFGFASVILTGVLQGGALVVESRTHFTDGSGRFDYYARETFRR